MKPPLPHSYWVDAGRFLAGEHPSGDSDDQTRKRLDTLLGAGITCFIDLTQPDECAPYQGLLPAQVRYHSHPLVDHGVPAEPAPMRAIQATLIHALRQGQGVYLHCRAGIGRTGITVGCHLVEQGERGDAALETLNHLWQQNARSRRWPRIPETPEQEDFILHWGVPARPARAIGARARGALLGLAVGDALSAPAQGRKPAEFPQVFGMVGGGVLQLPPGAWSDDTAMALCAAESLIQSQGFDGRDQMARYRHWQQAGHLSATGVAVGLRPAVRKAVALAGWRRTTMAGSHDPSQLDPEALVRCVSPAIYFHRDAAAAVAAGADTARVTHQAPVLVDACRLFTALVHAALNGQDKAQILGLAAHWQGLPLKEEVREMARRWTQPGNRRQPASGTILSALDAAVRAFAGSEDFGSGVLTLVNRGGDCDVTAAAYGQLMGAYLGEEAIPQAWRAALSDAALLNRYADALLKGP